SSRKVSSGGTCSFRCCSMPTFFNPGGRTLAGGDMMPVVMPWPCAEEHRASIPSRIAAITSGCEFLLLLTALLPFFFDLAWVAGWRSNEWRLVSRYLREREVLLPVEDGLAIRAARATAWHGRSECARFPLFDLSSHSCSTFFLPEAESH